MNGIAKAGNGTSEFIKEGERMQPKVSRYASNDFVNFLVIKSFTLTYVKIVAACKSKSRLYNIVCRDIENF